MNHNQIRSNDAGYGIGPIPSRELEAMGIPTEKGVRIGVQLRHPNARGPRVVQVGDVCADLYAAETTTIPARGRGLVKIGVAFLLPLGYRGRILARSGLSLKNGIEVGAGVIDNHFREEVGVLLYNHTDYDYEVGLHDRVAQIAFETYTHPVFVGISGEMPKTDRTAGWGSSEGLDRSTGF